MLTGYEGTGTTREYSVTGKYHFGVPTLEEPGSSAYPYSWVSYGGLYQGTPGYDFYALDSNRYLGSPKYVSGVGRFNYKYHFPANETGFVNSREATDNSVNPPSDGTPDHNQYEFGQAYNSMALKPSEFADGLWKNGTYRPMIFTGIITGHERHWDTFFGDKFNSEKRDNWETGVYVFQYYESGDAHRPNQIKGWWGLSSTGSGKFDHYRSVVENHAPINMGNKLEVYSPRSGNFPNTDASLNTASIVLNMGNPNLGNIPSDQGYQLPFSFNDGSFTFNYGMPFMEDQAQAADPTHPDYLKQENPFDDYEMNGVIISGNYPWYVHKTLVGYGTGNGARMSNLLLDSGNPAHNQSTSDPSSTFGTKFERIDGIRFVQKFK